MLHLYTCLLIRSFFHLFLLVCKEFIDYLILILLLYKSKQLDHYHIHSELLLFIVLIHLILLSLTYFHPRSNHLVLSHSTICKFDSIKYTILTGKLLWRLIISLFLSIISWGLIRFDLWLSFNITRFFKLINIWLKLISLRKLIFFNFRNHIIRFTCFQDICTYIHWLL